MTQSETDKELKVLVQAKYVQLVQDRGELFGRVSIPMDENDRAEVKKKQRVVAFVLAPLLISLLSVTLYFVWDGSLLSYAFLGFLGLIVILTAISYFNYEYLLKDNSKEILKGVITNKQRIDDGDNVEHDFEISNKETINVGRSNFDKFTIGDIVEIELLGDRASLKTKVKRIGTILDDKGVSA